MSETPFRIGAAKTELLMPPEACREAFLRDRAIACVGGIDPVMLGLAMRLLDQARFDPHEVERLGDREIEEPGRAGAALTLALQRTNLLDWLYAATGRGPLDEVVGRVVQARAGAGHALDWHDDRQEPRRRLAVTINLSAQSYEGGLFEIRRKKTHEPVFAHRHVAPGSVLIFDVAADIQHRIQPVTAGGPRRVFTGWFMAADGG